MIHAHVAAQAYGEKGGDRQSSRKVYTPRGRKGKRGRLFWVVGAVAFVAALLYWEQAALLYVLSTLAVCGLLLVVAFSDLEGRGKELTDATRQGKTAPAGGVEVPEAAAPPTERRAAKRSRREAA